MIIQLQNPIPVICPKGKGLAHFIIDDGIEHHLKWVLFLDHNGECWTFQNPEIRAQKNITQGRKYISPIDVLKKVSFFHMECAKCNHSELAYAKCEKDWKCTYCDKKIK